MIGAESPGRTVAERRASRRLLTLVAVRMVAGLVLTAAILFLAAGTADWPGAWALLVVTLGGYAVFMVAVVWRHPDLIEERIRVDRHSDVKRWDRPIVALAAIVLPPVMWLVAGFDRRYGWSPDHGMVIGVSALIAFAAGSAVTFWAMASNRFFSALVRIQHDRGHTVADRGPYAVVRHPGYVGAIVANIATPVVLGSIPALGIGMVIAVLFVIRTALEDRALQRELEGYPAYAARVRRRLVPAMW
jgi:protein-S-isoprenylcysteine O-methyltransferase Ste14